MLLPGVALGEQVGAVCNNYIYLQKKNKTAKRTAGKAILIFFSDCGLLA
jgi:hypothetical protein